MKHIVRAIYDHFRWLNYDYQPGYPFQDKDRRAAEEEIEEMIRSLVREEIAKAAQEAKVVYLKQLPSNPPTETRDA